MTILTENQGLNRHDGAREDKKLDVTRYVEMFRPGPDGYTDMTEYNSNAPWSGKSKS